MNNTNSEICVTSVTCSPLLQRMREKRRNIFPEKEPCLISPPRTIAEGPTKLQLPQLVIEWISISLREGHIQPSQPSVGRLEGWPIRSYFKYSLYVDFECWCSKSKIPPYLIPPQELFYQATDSVFESIAGEKYQFPDLTICQEKFSKFLKEIKHDQS